MATNRYWNVRQDIYEQCLHNPLKKFRSFADIKQLFRTSCWLMLVAMIICLISYFVLFFIFPNTFFWLIPVLIMFVLTIICEFWGEKMYNPSARRKEINEKSANLDKYIQMLTATLEKHGIVEKEQRKILKNECELQLSLHNKNYKSVSNKVFDMLVGVPLGALISALIFKSNSADLMINQLLLIIVVGLMLVGITSIIRKITYYSDGHFKDQCLLDALNELEYLT